MREYLDLLPRGDLDLLLYRREGGERDRDLRRPIQSSSFANRSLSQRFIIFNQSDRFLNNESR